MGIHAVDTWKLWLGKNEVGFSLLRVNRSTGKPNLAQDSVVGGYRAAGNHRRRK